MARQPAIGGMSSHALIVFNLEDLASVSAMSPLEYRAWLAARYRRHSIAELLAHRVQLQRCCRIWRTRRRRTAFAGWSGRRPQTAFSGMTPSESSHGPQRKCADPNIRSRMGILPGALPIRSIVYGE